MATGILVAAFICYTLAWTPIGAVPMFMCEPLDLTYTLNSSVPVYALKGYDVKGALKTTIIVDGVGKTADRYEDVYSLAEIFQLGVHVGTHMDAPVHFVKRRTPDLATVDEVPVKQLSGEACVIDVPDHAKGDVDYRITVDDILDWESRHGRLHADCIVIVRTGQGKHWPDRSKYLGGDGNYNFNQYGWAESGVHFPGLAPETAEWIATKRGMRAMAAEAMSLDAGNMLDFANSVHNAVLSRGIPGVENIANVGRLPNRGATVLLMPMKIQGYSGAPVRAVAYGWKGENDPCRWNAAGCTTAKSTLALLLAAFAFGHCLLHCQ